MTGFATDPMPVASWLRRGFRVAGQQDGTTWPPPSWDHLGVSNSILVRTALYRRLITSSGAASRAS
jgi:hypothetical protein